MLEVNDFNAIRISLASPEQIRSWSYGEVTKPETINYRTLKPEKDGLFCEKIFGPTKDFECYCGKYKRVRYKGIVCDKCGVEVTRSKVRRERMGHIELASPVAHIWFVKGTPSRIGLLLDISPRSLERILYFAQFIITWVDEEGKNRIRDQVREELDRQLGDVDARANEQLGEIETKLNEEIAKLTERQESELNEKQEERTQAVAELTREAQAIEQQLRDLQGQAAPSDIMLEGTVVVHQDAAINEFTIGEFEELVRGRLTEIEGAFAEDEERIKARFGAEIDQLRQAAESDRERIRQEIDRERTKVEEDLETKIDELDEIKPLTLLTEAKFRELRDKYGNLFRAGMGAEAVREIVSNINIDELRDQMRVEINSTSGQRRKKATKRLRVIEAFRKSGNRPEWMIFTVLPVLPPDLRPMVQLDGGRFATSDLNDLYRRVINRNNRLKRLLELGAPEIIIRNEKRMLQEAVDSLIDNGRRGRAVSGSTNHKLKSLSDMLKGKQGRFRQNLLGKRVDYSGRSVIVVGPTLKLHQCGLPKRMALELFKPFVMRKLVENNFAHNIKSAKRIVERVKPEVWDVLEDVIKERPVLLNRAPTLHRLGIQAFEPVLIDGSAIQIHPLVCTAFNADFDGDQMAVHVPLSQSAVREAREFMLSSRNLLSPSSGEPTVAPTLDMVLGCYYMTLMRQGIRGERSTFSPDQADRRAVFADPDEAKLAFDTGVIHLQEEIEVRLPSDWGSQMAGNGNGRVRTTIGRIIFNEVLPPDLRFRNEIMDKKELKKIVADCYRLLGDERTAEVVDNIKKLGFEYATRSGITISVSDIRVPIAKSDILARYDQRISEIDRQYRRGLITEDERYNSAVETWTEATDEITAEVQKSLDPFGSIHIMANSGAKGNMSQIRQMAGIRGLMSDPTGRIIELPIKSSFREGLSVLEYFISTHGARKGLADTALRTADSGYLTRRLIDVAQDVIVYEEDCGTTTGIWVSNPPESGALLAPLAERIVGRWAASPIKDPATGETIVDANEEITEDKAKAIVDAGIERVHVRSPLACQARRGLCRLCYGRSLARGHLVEVGEAVGIIAAQSIGEPGTQLTMRTFHTGGVAGSKKFLEHDITSGLPRVEELFEARVPKNQAVISEIDGVVEVERTEDSRRIRIVSSEIYRDEYAIPAGYELLVEDGAEVQPAQPIAAERELADAIQSDEKLPAPISPDNAIIARVGGRVEVRDGRVAIAYEEREERDYLVPVTARLRVDTSDRVRAGDQLTEGAINPQDILRIQGREAVQVYLVNEVQKVYRAQGVTINDKHIEAIVRQMMRKVRVDSPGDTEMLPGELVDRFVYEDINAKVLAEGGEPATAQTVLLGVTKASLNTDSFLAAASFQETTRVLTEAAINGMVDRLAGLKENVIIGKLIPAGTGALERMRRQQERAATTVLAEPGDETELEEGDLEAAVPVLPELDMPES